MNDLNKIKARAQQDANREQAKMMVFNLNRFSALYVIRNYDERAIGSDSLVAVIEPQAS